MCDVDRRRESARLMQTSRDRNRGKLPGSEPHQRRRYRGSLGDEGLPQCGQGLDPLPGVTRRIKQDRTGMDLSTAVGTWEGLSCHDYCCYYQREPLKTASQTPTNDPN